MQADRTLSRTEQLLELLVFLSLIVPSMILSLMAFQQEKATFGFVAWAVMLRDIALVALILFFMWRNGEGIELIGLTFRHGWREIGLGILLFVPFFFFAQGAERVFQNLGLSVPSGRGPSFLVPTSPADFVLAIVLVVVVAISEETMFRGYMIRRLGAITGSPAISVLLSAVIFALGHGYEGSAGMFTVGTMGIIFAVVYLWRKSLVAPMTMHFVQDFISIVLAPLLGLK